MTPALLPAQGRQRDRLRRSDRPAPRPPGQPSGGAAHGPALPPPPRQAGLPAAGSTRHPGLPQGPDRPRTPWGGCAGDERGTGQKSADRPAQRGEVGSHGAAPLLSPRPPTDPQATRAPASHRPEAGEMIPSPPGRAAAPGREAGAGPASTPQPPALAGAAMGKQTRASAQGRPKERAQRQQASTNRSGMGATPSMATATPRTPALLPAQGRQRDGLRQGDPPPHWPPRPHNRGERRTGWPPPPHPSPWRWNAPDTQTHPAGGTQPQAR